MERIFETYGEATLFYSGGKDSLVCLLLARPWWDRLSVVTVDTGEMFPEVRAHMERVKRLVPHFEVIHSDAASYHHQHGLPVDVVPTRNTATGDLLWGNEGIRCCSRFDCCRANIWNPMQAYFTLHRPPCVIRGDRGHERLMGGKQWENVRFEFPIFDWTTEQVHDYLRKDMSGLVQERHFLPDYSSLDCVWCTGYFNEQKVRMEYLKRRHPELAEQYVKFYKSYKQAVAKEMNGIGGID